MKYKTIIVGLLILLLISVNGIAQKSFDHQRDQLIEILRKITQTKTEIDRIDHQLNSIDQKITQLENRTDLTWLERRRIVKLTEEKALHNAVRLKYYRQVLDYQNSARSISGGLLESIATVIDSTLNQISASDSDARRQAGLDYLLGIIDLRNWIIDSQGAYAQIDEELYPEKIDIGNILSCSRLYPQIHDDLLNLMDSKIEKLTVMIKTAKEEEILQNRLDQFSLEMSSVGGEIKDQAYRPEEKPNRETLTDFTYSNDSGGKNNDYVSWALSTDAGPLSSLGSIDYLPIIKSLEPSELPDYIFTLDSLRQYYITEKQKLLNQ